jgi:hypothetical protein
MRNDPRAAIWRFPDVQKARPNPELPTDANVSSLVVVPLPPHDPKCKGCERCDEDDWDF